MRDFNFRIIIRCYVTENLAPRAGLRMPCFFCYSRTLQEYSLLECCLSPLIHCLYFSKRVKSITEGVVSRAKGQLIKPKPHKIQTHRIANTTRSSYKKLLKTAVYTLVDS